MEGGKCFEGMLRDRFDKSYSLSAHYYETDDNLPKRVTDMILSGATDDLSDLVRYKKDGEVYSADENLLEQIQKYQKMKGAFPILNSDWQLFEKLVQRMLELEVMNLKVKDFLDCALFDVCYVWDVSGIRKKCIFDILSVVEQDGQKVVVGFDLKLSRSVSGFAQDYRTRYWIQERHYSEAIGQYAKELGPDVADIPMLIFLAGYKDIEVVQEVSIDLDNLDLATDKYQELCYEYDQWATEGKPVSGHLDKKFLRIY
jgi:hypothetical protein